MVDAVPDDSADMLKTFGIAAPSQAFPRLQDALQYPTLNVRGLVERARRCRGAHDHSRPRDRGHGHPAGQGNASGRSRGEAARARSRAGLPPRRRRAHRHRARDAREDRRDRRLGDADQRLPHVAAGPAGRAASPPASRASSARRRFSFGRSAERFPSPRSSTHWVPGGARADGQLRQQSARGEREPRLGNLFQAIEIVAAILRS